MTTPEYRRIKRKVKRSKAKRREDPIDRWLHPSGHSPLVHHCFIIDSHLSSTLTNARDLSSQSGLVFWVGMHILCLITPIDDIVAEPTRMAWLVMAITAHKTQPKRTGHWNDVS